MAQNAIRTAPITPSLHHSITPSLQYSITPMLPFSSTLQSRQKTKYPTESPACLPLADRPNAFGVTCQRDLTTRQNVTDYRPVGNSNASTVIFERTISVPRNFILSTSPTKER